MRLGLHSGPNGNHVTYYPQAYLPGLGSLGDSTQQTAAVATQLASTSVGILAGLGAYIGPIAFAGPAGAAIAGAIVALGALAQVVIKQFSGCGQTCIIASDDANKYGSLMTQNLNAYLSAPVHYYSLQQAALHNFDAFWAVMAQACSDPQLGPAGQRCISDRQQGACVWKSSPGGWAKDSTGQWIYTAPGPSGSGDACWNYFIGMRDPIANDPTVVPDPTPGSNPVPLQLDANGNPIPATSTSSIPLPLLLGGAALLALAVAS